MKGPRDDARRAAEAWLTRHSLCEHDTGLLKFCPTCAEALASVIEHVAKSRGRESTVAGDTGEPPTEYAPLLAECHALVTRLHHALEVLADDDDDAAVAERLRAFRVALLKFAFREAGDPLAEEILSREGHDVG